MPQACKDAEKKIEDAKSIDLDKFPQLGLACANGPHEWRVGNSGKHCWWPSHLVHPTHWPNICLTLKLPRSENIVETDVNKAINSVEMLMATLKGLDITQAWAKWKALHDRQGWNFKISLLDNKFQNSNHGFLSFPCFQPVIAQKDQSYCSAGWWWGIRQIGGGSDQRSFKPWGTDEVIPQTQSRSWRQVKAQGQKGQEVGSFFGVVLALVFPESFSKLLCKQGANFVKSASTCSQTVLPWDASSVHMGCALLQSLEHGGSTGYRVSVHTWNRVHFNFAAAIKRAYQRNHQNESYKNVFERFVAHVQWLHFWDSLLWIVPPISKSQFPCNPQSLGMGRKRTGFLSWRSDRAHNALKGRAWK